MNAILFDTLRLARTLREKGFSPEQADGIAEALSTATHEDLATKADVTMLRAELKTDIAELKADIAELRSELKTDIAELRSELKTDIAELKGEIAAVKADLETDIADIKADILKWMVGAIGFQTVATLGTVVALVKIFAK